jgi:energy-coupling factor transporter transmembrane protein EcfT
MGSKIKIIWVIFLILILFTFGFTAIGEGETTSTEGEQSSDDYTEYDTYEEAALAEPEVTYVDETFDASSDAYNDFETNIDYETNVITDQGTIAEFSMTNALFSLGSLVQGSFFSFSDNNAIFFSTLFDASEFAATLNGDSQIDVAQRNSFGDTGMIYITLDSGNLTQDEVIIFVPEGDTPTYIYYNTTEVEFEDGTMYLLGEAISNLDTTSESTSIFFNENGFTRLELHPENIYTSFDYQIKNTGEETLIICKDDPLCDINIQDSQFTMSGLLDFSYQNETIYSSLDANNIFTIDLSLAEATLTNSRVSEEILAYIYSGNHLITETEESIYDSPIKETRSSLIQTYTSLIKEQIISIDNDDTLSYENFLAFDSEPEATSSPIFTAAVIGVSSSSSSSLGLILIFLGCIVMVSLLAEYKFKIRKKGQMSIFLTLGIVFLILIFIFIFVSQISLSNETGTTLSQVESLEQAREAIESCVENEVLEYFYLQGESGTYLALKNEELETSEFGPYYGFQTIPEIEANLKEYIDTNLDCSNILESTDYNLEAARFESSVSLTDEVLIEVESLGKVYKADDSVNYESVRDLEINLELDYIKLHLIMATIYTSELGNPIESYEGNLINTFVNRDYTEQLLVVYDEESEYILQLVKEL